MKIRIDKETGLTTYEFNVASNYAKCCAIKSENVWPTANQFGLDESQYQALKLALTNTLALIQG